MFRRTLITLAWCTVGSALAQPQGVPLMKPAAAASATIGAAGWRIGAVSVRPCVEAKPGPGSGPPEAQPEPQPVPVAEQRK